MSPKVEGTIRMTNKYGQSKINVLYAKIDHPIFQLVMILGECFIPPLWSGKKVLAPTSKGIPRYPRYPRF